MTLTPAERGRVLARLLAELAPQLFRDLEESGLLAAGTDPEVRARELREWECFALYACVRGLVASGGFNRETAAAIDALHEEALAGWSPADHGGEEEVDRRRLISARYEEYGAIGQAGGKSGAATVSQRLGEAAARHMTGSESPDPALAEMAGHLHESLAEGAAEAMRAAEAS